MSRIRSIFPGQWTDEDFIVLSPFARLLALAIRNEADDNGVFEWKPLQIKARLFPIDQVDVVELLGELKEHRQVAAYAANGRQYGIVRNFCRWQTPRRPKSAYPMPETNQVPSEFFPDPNAHPRESETDERQPSLEFEDSGHCPHMTDNVRPEEEVEQEEEEETLDSKKEVGSLRRCAPFESSSGGWAQLGAVSAQALNHSHCRESPCGKGSAYEAGIARAKRSRWLVNLTRWSLKRFPEHQMEEIWRVIGEAEKPEMMTPEVKKKLDRLDKLYRLERVAA